MFESNFPVDRLSLGYVVLWNGLKKIAGRYSDAEQAAMFSGTVQGAAATTASMPVKKEPE